MALNDYSHILTVGANCTPVKQLQIAARRLGLSEHRIRGPFDWLVAPLDSVLHAFNSGFRNFFHRDESAIVGVLREHWRVYCAQGFLSLHHFPRQEGIAEITDAAWKRFDLSVRRRIIECEAALDDPSGRVLIVRLEEAREADNSEVIATLADVIASRSRARITLASVRFGEPQTKRHALVRSFGVRTTWPQDLPIEFVDWDYDYGFGPAWQGHTESWARVWQEI